MRSRLAVIVMADMVDYTAAMAADQTGTVGRVQQLRERWLEPEVEARDGEVLKRMGDGWIIAFSSATKAVEMAQAVQVALAGHGEIRLRIAVHLGEIIEDEADLYGTGVNIAARLQSEAPPGGVMISEDLHRQLDTRLSEGFSDAGSFKLKNIAHPVSGFQWRPAEGMGRPVEDLPVIAIEPIAVAPDTTEGRDAAADLQEQLLHSLSRRTGIRVMVLEGATPEVSTASTYRLRGRIRTRGDIARITLSMVVTETGQVTWSGSYEGSSGDLFSLSDKAAAEADTDIRYAINSSDNDRLDHLPDEALSVSELRARAANAAYRASSEGMRHAVTLLERGLRLAPEDPMSLAMWADFHLREILVASPKPDSKTGARMLAAVDAAVQGMPRSDYVLYARAIIRIVVAKDLDGARRDLDRAIQINPGFIYLDLYIAWLEMVCGAPGKALEVLRARWLVRRQDVYWLLAAYLASIAALLDEKYEESISIIREAVEARPSCHAFRIILAEALAAAGEVTRAEQVRQDALRIPHQPDVFAPLLDLPGDGAPLMTKLAPRETTRGRDLS